MYSFTNLQQISTYECSFYQYVYLLFQFIYISKKAPDYKNIVLLFTVIVLPKGWAYSRLFVHPVSVCLSIRLQFRVRVSLLHSQKDNSGTTVSRSVGKRSRSNWDGVKCLFVWLDHFFVMTEFLNKLPEVYVYFAGYPITICLNVPDYLMLKFGIPKSLFY